MGSFESHPLTGVHCGGQSIPLATIAARAFAGPIRWLHRSSPPGGNRSHIVATADSSRRPTFHGARLRYAKHLLVDRKGVFA